MKRKSSALCAMALVSDFAVEQLERRQLLSGVVWSTLASLPAGRGDATALAAGTGLVIIGGREATGTPSTVYEFSDADGTWSRGPSLEQGRTAAGAAYAPYVLTTKYSSNLFLFGGTIGAHATATAYNYSPNPDGDSTNATSMSTARASFAYTSDPSTGTLYAIGGLSSTNAPLASAERYDPLSDSWSAIAPLPQALYGASAASDGFGHIFVIGGSHTVGGAPLSNVYRYTIATDSWDQAASLNLGVRDAAAVAAPDGKLYVIGGIFASGAVANVESYNPAINSWSDETPLDAPVYGAAAAIDWEDNLVVIGGFNNAGTPVTTVSMTPITPGLVTPFTPTLQVNDNWYVYDGTPHGVSGTALGTDGVTPVDGTFSFTYNGASDLPTAAGDYKVIANFDSADPNYLSSVSVGDLYIAQATPTLTLSGGGTFKYDGQAHAATATQVGIDGKTPVAGSLLITYNGASTPPVNAGTYSVLASFASADPNYADTSASTTITIPDPTIPTGVTAVGASTTSILLTWDAAPVPVAGYNIYERHVLHDPKGSGATITYPLVAANVQGTSATIGVAAASAATGGHTYYVSSVSLDGVVSPKSAPAPGKALYAPSLYGALLGGAVVSGATVQAGQSVQVTLLEYGNEKPTFSLVSGPDTITVDPITGVVTYSPALTESGYVSATFKATNSVGSATETLQFQVLPAPGVASTSLNVAGQSVSLQTAADGLRLLPAGRATDIPWAGVSSFAVTLSAAAVISASDVSVTGASGIDYGPVTLAGSGTGYTISLARPIGSADRVTLHIANATMAPFTRRLDILPGDVNDDGQIGFADLVTIAQNYGRAGDLSLGDLTGDGQVNFADLVLVAQGYGGSLPPDSAPAAAVAAALPVPALSVASNAPVTPAKPAKTTSFSTTRVKAAPVTLPPLKSHKPSGKSAIHRH